VHRRIDRCLHVIVTILLNSCHIKIHAAIWTKGQLTTADVAISGALEAVVGMQTITDTAIDGGMLVTSEAEAAIVDVDMDVDMNMDVDVDEDAEGMRRQVNRRTQTWIRELTAVDGNSGTLVEAIINMPNPETGRPTCILNLWVYRPVWKSVHTNCR
jgi:hypothetical protein